MTETRTFSAPIEAARGGGAYVTVPFDVEEAYGKKRVAVRARIDGIEYRGSLVRMGGSDHILGVLKAIREQLGKEIGDVVEVVVEEDTAPREVEVPDDLKAALAGAPGARTAFETLSYSHQREYVDWITQAKRAQTREDRIAKALGMLARGEKRS